MGLLLGLSDTSTHDQQMGSLEAGKMGIAGSQPLRFESLLVTPYNLGLYHATSFLNCPCQESIATSF